MKTISLPKSDLVISKAIFGTSRLGGTMERFDKREALEILGTVADAGITSFDTADIYAQGNSERLLAEAFKGRRDQLIYATKGGYVLSNKARVLARVKPLIRRFMKAKPSLAKAAGRARGGQMTRDFSRSYLTRALEASLARLKTDHVDIYQLHSPSTEDLKNGDAFETLADLKKAGKIRAYGVSLLSWEDLPHCIGKGFSWAQVTASLPGNTEDHQSLLQMAGEDELMLVARQIFGGGLLGRVPESLTAEDFDGDIAAMEEVRDRLKALAATGDPRGAVLRYHMDESPYGAFLFATTRMENLRQNLEFLSSTTNES